MSLRLQIERSEEQLLPMVPTTLQQAHVDWHDIAAALYQDAQLFVALLLLDNGPQSEAIRGELKKRWFDLERALGDHLALIVPAEPKPDWLNMLRPTLNRLDPSLRRVVKAEGQSLSSELERQRVDVRIAGLVREHLGADEELPGVLIFRLDDTTAPEGWYVSIKGEAHFRNLLRRLGAAAEKAALRGGDVEWLKDRFGDEEDFRRVWRKAFQLKALLDGLRSLAK